jgi:tRNA A37 threonylcarbamoyladenosine dehydratase
VGSLVLVDRDVVTPSNVNRQALAFQSTLGRPKAEVMQRMVADINPDCEVTARELFLDKDELAGQLASLPRPDYVVDAIDTMSQKLAIASWCHELGIPLVSAMGGANKLDPCRLRFAPLEKTSIDPLARIIRKEARKRGIGSFMCLYSDEQPREPEGKWDAIGPDGFVLEGQSILGTMSYLPPIMGQMLASYVIRDLLGLL